MIACVVLWAATASPAIGRLRSCWGSNKILNAIPDQDRRGDALRQRLVDSITSIEQGPPFQPQGISRISQGFQAEVRSVLKKVRAFLWRPPHAFHRLFIRAEITSL